MGWKDWCEAKKGTINGSFSNRRKIQSMNDFPRQSIQGWILPFYLESIQKEMFMDGWNT